MSALTLVLGYAVASVTGIRSLGGLVLVAGVAVCAVAWLGRIGIRGMASLVAVFVGLFVASHLLALVVGAWPAVLAVALAMFVIAALVGDRSKVDKQA